jgi:hypothetical protein
MLRCHQGLEKHHHLSIMTVYLIRLVDNHIELVNSQNILFISCQLTKYHPIVY